MARERVERAIIVGGGIGGPVLGMWLRQLGLEVVLAERRVSSARAEGAFLGLAPNGMNVLGALGLAEAVGGRGAPCGAFRFHNAAGRPIGEIDRSADAARFGAPLLMVRRGELQELLLEEAERRGVQVLRGARLLALDTAAPRSVGALFEDGRTAHADLLVGCDGLRSATRQLLMPEAPEPAFTGLWDYGGFASDVRTPLRPGVNEMVFGRRAFFGAFLTPRGEVWWFHNGPQGPTREGPDTGARERLLELHADDPPWVRDVVRATPEVLGPWRLHELRDVPRWSRGRVCLLGDAAHAMPPSAGQGASMALEDAMVLAICLRDVETPEAAFARYERLRRPRVEAIAAHARRNGARKAPPGPLALALRDLLLPLGLRLGARAQDRSYAHRISWEAPVG